jgi:tetratricopeptide (TPR) repeat protein
MSKSNLQDFVNEMVTGARIGMPMQTLKETDQHDTALTASIKENLALEECDDDAQNQLSSPVQKRIKAELDVKSLFEKLGLRGHILTTIQTVLDDGRKYLSQDEYEAVKENFKEAKSSLEKVDPKALVEMNVDQILGLTEHTIESIFKIGSAKCQEGDYPIALSLFVVLTVLQPSDFDLWHRTAIIAQGVEDFDLALRAYTEATRLNKGLIEAYIFSVECYLMKGLQQDAKEAYLKAEKAIEEATSPVHEETRKLLDDLKTMLTT